MMKQLTICDLWSNLSDSFSESFKYVFVKFLVDGLSLMYKLCAHKNNVNSLIFGVLIIPTLKDVFSSMGGMLLNREWI